MGLPQTQSFSYDPLDRLLSASASGGFNGVGDYSQSYSYDPLSGNLAAKGGVSYSYGDSGHAHAVTSLSNGSSFQYDANGNMTQRIVNGQTYNLSYDAENRLAGVSGANTASFIYNGDGERVVSTVGGVVVVYVGEYFEWQPATTASIRYYYAGGQRVAMRMGSAPPLWLLGDHLGSTAVVANTDATQHSRKGYKAFGETRFAAGSLPTRYQFTGQASHESDFGLYFYKARWYDPALGRWTSLDTVVPSPGNPLDWDRYSYTRNNPIKYLDPGGHTPIEGDDYPPPEEDNPLSTITVDDENGICIKTANIGCSGTIQSNLEWILLNTGYIRDPQFWNDLSLFFTDAAFAASTAGATAEITGAILGSEGGPFGIIVGAIGGNEFHIAVTNPIESGLSGVATFTTVFFADPLSGNSSLIYQNGTISVTIGEASATAIASQSVGTVMNVGVIDAIIDAYASTYSHGQAPGVFDLFGISGASYSLGPLTIIFGR